MVSETQRGVLDENSDNSQLILSVLAAGLYPRVGVLRPGSNKVTVSNEHTASLPRSWPKSFIDNATTSETQWFAYDGIALVRW